jgi:hypothetical protein
MQSAEDDDHNIVLHTDSFVKEPKNFNKKDNQFRARNDDTEDVVRFEKGGRKLKDFMNVQSVIVETTHCCCS